MKTFGKLTLSKAKSLSGNTVTISGSVDKFIIECEPHVSIRLKSVIRKIDKSVVGKLCFSTSLENCRDLEWFLQRYPMVIEPAAERTLTEGSSAYRKNLEALEEIGMPNYVAMPYPNMCYPPRHYQAQAIEIYLRSGKLLIADQMGLGKTVCALGSFCNPKTLPALIVMPGHIQKQWQRDFLGKFLPLLQSHIIKRGAIYQLPDAAVYIISYHKLTKWGDYLLKMGLKSIIFDEVQELRHADSQKYRAASQIRNQISHCMGLSGTPIYNYGDEMHKIMDVIAPGCLGTFEEYVREWCGKSRDPILVSDPPALRSHLKEQFLMVRRTRAEVGLELPKAQKVIQQIPYDLKVLDEIKGHATELAKIILNGKFEEAGQAAREFDMKLRMQTGIAKAPFVAEFVNMLIDDGSPIILFGWHRAVYDIWAQQLARHRPVFYTGHESEVQKDRSIQEFLSGRSQLFIMSSRSGAGIDGLQKVCSTGVFGELDWSNGVHDQCEARYNRDGVGAGCMSYFMVCEGGSDPLVAELLGLKDGQRLGILDGKKVADPMDSDVATKRIRQLAERYLSQKHATIDV